MTRAFACVTLLVGTFALPTIAPGQEKVARPIHVVRKFSFTEMEPAYNTHRFLLGPEVVADSRDGTVRLAHSVLVTDEIGATDFLQTEPLSDRVLAKKVFLLDSPDVKSAELFLFGNAEQIHVNGKTVGKSERLVSTGWTRAKIPATLLKAGENEIVFSGGGSLLVEPGRGGRSTKSTDAGRTWSSTSLTSKNNQKGEYLIRLRLGRYAAHGTAMSQVFDLWRAGPRGIGTPGKLVAASGVAEVGRGQPKGTHITTALRTGKTPTPDTKNWTDWIVLDKGYKPDLTSAGHRWAQLRFEFFTTRSQTTPRLPRQFDFAFDFQADSGLAKDQYEIIPPNDAADFHEIQVGSTPFVYQEPSTRLKKLRERYQLDKVIAPGKTEMEQLMLLRHWVRNQWHNAWGTDPTAWMPAWDALVILESKDQPDCLTMCTHYAAVFTQCCLALGWNARHCILDHHCVAEVWVDQHQKWVMVDAGNSSERADVTLHFERHGVPMSAWQLHMAQRTGKLNSINVCFTPAKLIENIAPLCRPVPSQKAKNQSSPPPDVIPLAELPKYPVCGIENYRRYAFPGRNNYLESLLPGELYQGWSEYFYDGYYWVGDSADDPQISPEYSRPLDPARSQDIDWSLNWTRIHLARTAKAGELKVDLETLTPNLARLERRDEKGWQPTAATFIWILKSGNNELRVRSVNQWDRAGAESKVVVKWTE